MEGFSWEKAQGFYYSAHHLARDLFWNAGAFAFFVLCSAILSEPLRSILLKFVYALDDMKSPIIQIGISFSCIGFSVVAGFVSLYIFNAAIDLLPRKIISRLTYDGYYFRDRKLIEDVYKRIFGAKSELLMSSGAREMDMIVRLTGLLRFYNPSGYVHVFRTYSIVALFRQLIVYFSFFLVHEAIARSWAIVIGMFVVVLSLFIAYRRTLAYSITREYAFIVATIELLDLGESLGTGVEGSTTSIKRR